MSLQIGGTARRTETTYGPGTLWIVVVAMNREYGQGDIQIWIFVIDRRETGVCVQCPQVFQ